MVNHLAFFWRKSLSSNISSLSISQHTVHLSPDLLITVPYAYESIHFPPNCRYDQCLFATSFVFNLNASVETLDPHFILDIILNIYLNRLFIYQFCLSSWKHEKINFLLQILLRIYNCKNILKSTKWLFCCNTHFESFQT